MRWTITDVESSDVYTFEINPNKASSPLAGRQIDSTFYHERPTNADLFKVTVSPSTPVEWQFEGVLRSQAQHDDLEEVFRRPGLQRVGDHLGRVFEGFIQDFLPVDRRPTPNTPWRLTYTVKMLVLREVAP